MITGLDKIGSNPGKSKLAMLLIPYEACATHLK